MKQKKLLLALLSSAALVVGCTGSGGSNDNSSNVGRTTTGAISSKLAMSNDWYNVAYVQFGASGSLNKIPSSAYKNINVVVFAFANINSTSADSASTIKGVMGNEAKGTLNFLSIGGETVSPGAVSASTIVSNVLAQLSAYKSAGVKFDGVDLDLENGFSADDINTIASGIKSAGYLVSAAPQVYTSSGSITSANPTNLVLTSGGSMASQNTYGEALQNNNIDYLFVQTYNTGGYTVDGEAEGQEGFFKAVAKALNNASFIPSATQIIVGEPSNAGAGGTTIFTQGGSEQSVLDSLASDVSALQSDSTDYANIHGVMEWSLNNDYDPSEMGDSAASAGQFTNTIFNQTPPTPVPPSSQLNTYDFGPTMQNKYSGQYNITVNAGSTKISTITFVTNGSFSNIGSGYGSLLNAQPKISTSNLDNGDTQYTLTYSSPISPGQGIMTIPYNQDGTGTSSTGTGAPLNTAAPIIKSLSVNGTTYNIVNMPKAAINPNTSKTITGYLEEWSIYRPYASGDSNNTSAYRADTIPYTQLNTVNYGFINFTTPTKSLSNDSYPAFGSGSYEIVSGDDTADFVQLTELYKNKLRYPYLHVFLSFGGWTNDNQMVYPDINYENMTDAQQQTFAQNAVNTMVSLGFDGVDIDWEWWANHNTTSPAVCGTKGTPAAVTAAYCSGKVVAHSSQKYLNLFKYLRQDLDAAGSQYGKTYYLSTAVSASATRVNAEETAIPGFWKTLSGYVNYVDVMAYDMHGGFDANPNPTTELPGVTDSQAPWDSPSNDPYAKIPGNFTIKSALEAYKNSGVNASQIILGFPAYGRASNITGSSTDINGMYATITGTPTGEIDNTGVFFYRCIVSKGLGCTQVAGGNPSAMENMTWAEMGGDPATAQGTPWGFNDGLFVTYDDPASIGYKVKAASADTGIGGAMLWALDNDSVTPSNSLIYALNQSMAGNYPQPGPVTPGTPTPGSTPTPSPTASPNPSPTSGPVPSVNCSGIQTWSSSASYATSGMKVVYNNIEYSNNYWTSGNEPDTNSGAAGDAWTVIGQCGGTPIPTPTTTPSPVPTPSPTVVPTPTPTTSPGNYQVYPSGLGSYNVGSEVQGSDGNLYKCTVAAWCNMSAYSPTGIYGSSAWSEVSSLSKVVTQHI